MTFSSNLIIMAYAAQQINELNRFYLANNSFPLRMIIVSCYKIIRPIVFLRVRFLSLFYFACMLMICLKRLTVCQNSADDTCLIFTTANLASLTTIMNKELQNLSIWFDSNKLTVNLSKSNFLIIPPKLNKPFPQTNVFLNNISISQCIV